MLRQFNPSVAFLLTGLFLFAGGAAAQMTYTSVPAANSASVGVTSNIVLDFDADVSLPTVHNNTVNPGNVFDDNIKIIGSQSGQFRGVFSVGADN